MPIPASTSNCRRTFGRWPSTCRTVTCRRASSRC